MLRIPKALFDSIIEHAQRELPLEACGYVAGVEGEVKRLFPMRNVDASPEHFSFDPAEQFSAFKEAQKEGLRLIGCYHSHPSTPARPSDEDIRLAYDSSLSYLIVSLAKEPVLNSFKIKEGVVTPENIEVI